MIHIHLTEEAALKIQDLRVKLDVPENYALRIGVAQQGCSGDNLYQIGFDAVRDSDLRANIRGINIILDPSKAIFVVGMLIDWRNIDGQEGFVFTDPTKDLTPY